MRKLVVAAAAFLAAVPAFAKVVTYEYTGVISTLYERSPGGSVQYGFESSLIPGGLAIQDTFHGRFSWDTSVPLTSATPNLVSFINHPGAGQLPAPVSSLVIDKSGTTIVTDGTAPSLLLRDDVFPSFTIVTRVDADAPGRSELEFSAYIDPQLVQYQIIPDRLAVTDFMSPSVKFSWSSGGEYLGVTGRLTSLTSVSPVPEPETYMFWMAGAALAGAGTLRKRYRSSKQ